MKSDNTKKQADTSGKVQTEKKESTGKRTGKPLDWVVKLLCVCAAFILWLYVMEVESPEYETIISDITVELTGQDVMNENSDITLYSGAGLPISVTVAGKKSIINRIGKGDIVASADLSKITTAGRHAVPILVDLPSGVSLRSLSQENITVYVDTYASKNIEIRENTSGMNLPDGYEKGEIQLEHSRITVSGPKMTLDQIDQALVDVDYSGRTSSFSFDGEIRFVNKQNVAVSTSYISYTPTETRVEVPIYKRVNVPVEVSFLHGYLNEENAVITVTPSTVTIKGDETVMNVPELLEPIRLNEKEIRDNVYTKIISLSAAPGTFIDGGMTEALISVEIDPSIQTMDMPVTDIQVTGADDISYVVETDVLAVTLKGPLEQLLKIRPSDVYAMVDLSTFNPDSTGTVQKNAMIVIDAEDAEGIYEVGQYTVSVRMN